MIALTVILLTLLTAACVISWVPQLGAKLDALPWWLVATIPAAVLAVTAILAGASDEPLNSVGVGASSALAIAVAILGGGPVTTAILRGAEQSGVPGVSRPTETLDPAEPSPPTQREILAGGLWIGALERAAIAACILVGMPEGIALVLGLKGVGRYNELRAPGAAERFIIGTFTSVLWAASCAGVAILLR